MQKTAPTFAAAALVFLDALGRYQSATLELNVARQKLNATLIEFSKPLRSVVLKSGVATGNDRRQRYAA